MDKLKKTPLTKTQREGLAAAKIRAYGPTLPSKSRVKRKRASLNHVRKRRRRTSKDTPNAFRLESRVDRIHNDANEIVDLLQAVPEACGRIKRAADRRAKRKLKAEILEVLG